MDARATEFERLLARHGVEPARVTPLPGAQPPLEVHPLVRFEPERCIACRRCVAACESIQGQFVFAIAGRGGSVRLTTVVGAEGRTDCTACGACVDQCPTGALSDADRVGATPGERTRSVCGYCGVGCAVEIESRGGEVLRVSGVADSPVNRGHLCAKGRFAHAHRRSPERLVRPLVRERGVLRAVSWDDALDFAARRLRELRELHGPEALGVLTSSRSTNEAAYLLQRLFRAGLGTNHVDCCARVCHASTAEALRDVTGTGAASASFADIEHAHTVVIAGANPTEAHPVVGARLKQAARRGARIIAIDPRATELGDYAAVWLRLRPGTNVALWNALARVLHDEDLVDREYVAAHCEGFAELRALLDGVSVDAAAAITGVPAREIREAARLLSRGPTLFVWGLGLSEQSQGTDAVRGLANLALLTGNVGRPGAGLLPLRGQNNVQGNADMGSMPELVTGYQRLDDPAVRARLEREWGAPPPRARGKTLPEMLDAAARGELRALWIQGEDVAQSDPNETHVRAALARLDFLVVQELFETETTAYAHVVLPAAAALEQDGTFTNSERRIQRVRRAVPPPGGARADWEVIRDVGLRLGVPWSHASPAQVMDEIARVAPHLFGGVAYDRLDGGGLQWPCPSREHPGTATLHSDGFLRGKGRLAPLTYRPPPEQASARFPYLLITGRVLEHYNVGTMTRRTPLAALAPADLLEVHPVDAAREGIADGARVRVESRWGDAVAPARITERVAPGQLFLSFHWPETHANRVTGPSVDPESRCPDYKVTAVRLRPDAGDGAPAPRDDTAPGATSRRARSPASA
jgi:formate dehydrogenase alpha subunit